MVACSLLCRGPLILSFGIGIYLIFRLSPLSPILGPCPYICPPCISCLEKRTASPRSRSPQHSRWEPRSSCLLLSPLLHPGIPSSRNFMGGPPFVVGPLLSKAPRTFSCFSHLLQLSSRTESHNSSPLPWDPQPHFWLHAGGGGLVLCQVQVESLCM